MNPILDNGIKIILFVQNLGGWLAIPMQFFSFLGNEQFFLLVMPVFLWCIDLTVGLRLGFLLLIGDGLNNIFKLAFHAPRPYWVDTHVKAYTTETSFGLPSGHAQNSTGIWGGLAASIKERWLWITSLVVIFFIGVSRIYNGVHFPTDVLAGWAIGAVFLWIYLKLEKPISVWLGRQSLSSRILAALGISLLLVGITVVVKLSLGAWTIPQEWIANAAAAVPGSEPIAPLSLASIFTDAGALFGLAAGAVLLPAWGGFNAAGPLGKRLLRFVVGVIGVLLLWQGLDKVFPGGENLLSYFLRYLRYALVGFWVSGLAPLVFVRLGLAERNRVPQDEVRTNGRISLI